MIALALAIGLAAAGVDTTRADSARSLTVPPWWEVASMTSAESFVSRLAMWQWHSVAVRHRGRSATHGVELFGARRAGVWNRGFAVEETRAIGARGYATVRGQIAPGARVIPRYDLSVEAYHGFGAGWEISPSARLMRYEDVSVPIVAVGLGRYLGAWYLRGRVSRAHMAGESGFTSQASARRYFSDSPTDYFDASYAIGHEVTPLSPTIVDLRRTTDAVARGQKVISRGVGVSLALSYSTNESLPDRRGASLGAFLRW